MLFDNNKKQSPIIGIPGMGGGVTSYAFISSSGGGDYTISRSLRFNEADTTYLYRTPSAGNRQAWTWSGWVKKSQNNRDSNDQCLFSAYGASNDTDWLEFGFGATSDHGPADKIYWTTSGTHSGTTELFRDLSAWYHIVASYDGSNLRFYVNNDLLLTSSKSGNLGINGAHLHRIGRSASSSTRYFNGYMADLNFIDGSALTPSSFGEVDSSGIWQPKAYSGSRPGNSFYLKFLDNSSASALGTDSSGNGNTWDQNGFSVAAGVDNDSLRDSPINGDSSEDTGAGGLINSNYATLNPYTAGFGGDLKNGNLDYDLGANVRRAESTLGFNTGKFYWEAYAVSGTTNGTVGGRVSLCTQSGSSDPAAADLEIMWHSTSGVYRRVNGSATSILTGTNYSDGDTIGVGVDADSNIVYFWKNGTLAYTYDFSAYLTTGTKYLVAHCYNASSGTPFWKYNFGQRPFTYGNPGVNRPAATFKTLCTSNLTTPTIGFGTAHFDITEYTGSSPSAQSFTYGFTPDLVWLKSKTSVDWHQLYDSVRGYTMRLFTNEQNADDPSTQMTSFDANGFTLSGNSNGGNDGGKDYVVWNWDAGSNSNKTYTVKVVSDSGNKYRFDDYGTSAVTLDLAEGSTYVFDSSDSTMDSHPFVLGTSANSNEYSTGVVYTLDGVVKTYSEYISGFPSATTRKLTITVAASAPVLYYWCYYHSGMGGQVNTNSTEGSSNFDGDLQAVVKASSATGFSCVKWTGDGTSKTTGHGLSKAPQVIIMKENSTSAWYVYTTLIDGTYDYLNLNSNDAKSNSSNAAPTSSVFSYSGPGSHHTRAWCFHAVDGYSAIGVYTANNGSFPGGSFIYTGMRPKWVMIKCTSNSTYGHWFMFDAVRSKYNVVSDEKALAADLADSEGLSGWNSNGPGNNAIDIYSNGFKLMLDSTTGLNSSDKFLYMAFAEHPIATARAR